MKVVDKETSSSATPANRRRGKRRRLWSRTKSSKKKPKFLSLREKFPAANDHHHHHHQDINIIVDNNNNKDHHQLIKRRCTDGSTIVQSTDDEIKECHHHDQENVALFFSGGEGGATTLTGLLDAAGAAASDLSLVNNSSSSCRLDHDLSMSSVSLTYGYGGKDPSVSAAALVRNALRSRERDSSEEKWVCYSEVVERKEVAVAAVVKEEEVTSSSAAVGRLSLKLDYEEILNAWSDKGRSLYIDAGETNSLQIVPDFNDDHQDHELLFNSEASTNNNGMSGELGRGNMNLWTVPQITTVEIDQNGTSHEMKKMTRKQVIDHEEEELKTVVGHREARLLRYKEKRLNRLFSKTIRYQVRKLNAEKRPRIKGRFVKRS